MSVFDNVASRLKEAIPKRPDGKPITAWAEFATFMNKLVGRVGSLEDRVLALEGGAPPPPPPPPPDPPPARYAPRTYNKANFRDAIFCIVGLPRNAQGEYYEPSKPSVRYDENGKSLGGAPGDTRDPDRIVPGIKPADQTDGRGPCDPYTHDGRAFPPWPPESFLL